MAESEQIWWTYVKLENVAEIYSVRIDSRQDQEEGIHITASLLQGQNIKKGNCVCPSLHAELTYG